jgi:hypothetical protein
MFVTARNFETVARFPVESLSEACDPNEDARATPPPNEAVGTQ